MSSDRPPDFESLRRAFPYPQSHTGAISVLGQELKELILQEGPIPFSEFMAQCLYHPKEGYYARPHETTVSKEGDFMTSVSVGPVFGQLLARRLYHFWQRNGNPHEFSLFEVGAHNGTLAQDIVSQIAQLDEAFAKATRYHIIEPLPAQRDHLQATLGDQFTILASPPETPAAFGALIANEVFDALPLPLLLFSNQQWHEAMVTWNDDHFDWGTRPTETHLSKEYPEGYVTEGTPDLAGFLTPLTRCFERGMMTFFDYGLDEASLYHPSRTVGTLRCYRQHSNKAHPLDHPGEQDITADVNFSAVERVTSQLGLRPCQIMDQGRFLTYCAKAWLTSSQPPTPGELRQFQTLIHPSQFGTRFYALELLQGEVDHAFP